MRHGSLFSGIGGFDLAEEWMGWENVFHCEWNEFGKKVLKHYWPNAESFDDITKTDFTKYEGEIDIISGGFPCQPYSSAGKRKGKEDERHLWPEMLRTIREIKPSFVVGENVRGLTNWNGGMVFDEVCAELEALGYQVAPIIIPACGLGAPHKRERIWFVAYSNGNDGRSTNRESGCEESKTNRTREQSIHFGIGSTSDERNATNTDRNGLNQCNSNDEINPSQGGEYAQCDIEQSNGNGDVANTKCCGGLQRGENIQSQKPNGERIVGNGRERNATDTSCGGMERYGGRSENGKFQTNEFNKDNSKRQPKLDWEKFPTQSPVCGGDDGLSTKLDGITFSKWRSESIKGYGNAIVPQVALQIFKAIEQTIK